MPVQLEASESTFTDNDGLAAKLALQLHADLVVLMTDVDGVYTGPPADPDSKLIDVWCPSVHEDLIKIGEKSTHGRGGMSAKIRAAWYGAQNGATVVIMNGKHPENLVRIIDGEKVRCGRRVGAARMRRLLRGFVAVRKGGAAGERAWGAGHSAACGGCRGR